MGGDYREKFWEIVILAASRTDPQLWDSHQKLFSPRRVIKELVSSCFLTVLYVGWTPVRENARHYSRYLIFGNIPTASTFLCFLRVSFQLPYCNLHRVVLWVNSHVLACFCAEDYWGPYVTRKRHKWYLSARKCCFISAVTRTPSFLVDLHF